MKRNSYLVVSVAFISSIVFLMARMSYKDNVNADTSILSKNKTIPIRELITDRPSEIYPKLPYKEFIFPPANYHSNHASSIVELPDGGLFAVWYAPPKWSPHSMIWGSRRLPGASEWTKPYVVHYDRGHSDKNPVLYLGTDNKLFLFWATEKRIWKLVKDEIYMKTSDDFGRTWGKARQIENLTWFLPKTHLLRLSNGDIILPIYTDLSTSSAVAISKDGGMTWQGPKYMLLFFGIQPTIIERSDKSLFALMRTGMPPRLAWQAISPDQGSNWKTRKYSNVDNPGTCLEMIRLNNGHIVLASNDDKKNLHEMVLSLSLDEGKTWPYRRVIEYDTQYPNTYPSLMQDRYGLIHVLYSYNGRETIAHFVTDEDWIKAGDNTVKTIE
ncbi:MAG: exo-alpha-sialidase [Candidatus Omnitrophica bacterium]|nr:exo-alpha-sialidase [Candidatus Omnitrophota bacterium]